MDMTGERRIPAPREKVWAALSDPEVLRRCIPGCDSVSRTGPGAYSGAAGVRIGPISARFTGEAKVADAEPPAACTIAAEAQGGVAGSARIGAKLRLADDPGGTLLTYEVDAELAGKIAQLGSLLIDPSARQMADQFLDCLAKTLAGDEHPPAAAPATATREAAPIAAPVAAPAAASILSQIPAEIFGLPIVAWIGIAIFLPIFFLIFSAYL